MCRDIEMNLDPACVYSYEMSMFRQKLQTQKISIENDRYSVRSGKSYKGSAILQIIETIQTG